MKSKQYKGIVYFESMNDASNFGFANLSNHPDYKKTWRVVSYERGYAVQVRISGDYLAANGLPSMTNAMEAFFS